MAQSGSIDAWVQAELDAFFSTNGSQTQRYRAYCKITINGVDVTDRLAPYLVSLTIRITSNAEATIELDDRDGRLDIPPPDAKVEIDLGWSSESSYMAFQGYVWTVMHGFGRTQGGRRMFVHAYSMDLSSKIKTPFQDHVGEGAPPGATEGTKIPLTQAFQQFAQNSGMTAVVGPSLMGVVRDYWYMSNESILQWGSRHADELGAVFSTKMGIATLAREGDFPQAPMVAKWGDNLIGWKLQPFVARSSWAGSLQQNFDHVQGLWNQIEQQFGMTAPWGGSWITALSKLPNPASNADATSQHIEGAQYNTARFAGYGRVIINGEPKAQPFGVLQIVGARPGVDGAYVVDVVTQTYSRQGFVTLLEVHPYTETKDFNVGDLGYDSYHELSNQPGGQPGEAAGP